MVLIILSNSTQFIITTHLHEYKRDKNLLMNPFKFISLCISDYYYFYSLLCGFGKVINGRGTSCKFMCRRKIFWRVYKKKINKICAVVDEEMNAVRGLIGLVLNIGVDHVDGIQQYRGFV